MSQKIFDDPEAFQSYAGRMASRLRNRWEDRINFLQNGMAQLRALQRVAQAVRDDDALAELSEQINSAQEELRQLKDAVSGGGGSVEPPPTPPPRIGRASVATVAPAPPAPLVPPAATLVPAPVDPDMTEDLDEPPPTSSGPGAGPTGFGTIAWPVAESPASATTVPDLPTVAPAVEAITAEPGANGLGGAAPAPASDEQTTGPATMGPTRRMVFNLSTGQQTLEWVENNTLAEKLGGIGRSFSYIRQNYQPVRDSDDPRNPLILNVGCLTGTKAMTGLRIYFTAFSPLKQSRKDDPGIAYSAASGDFGTFFRRTGLDDLVLLGRADRPSVLVLEGDGNQISARLEDGAFLQGMTTNEKVQALQPLYPQSHFAVVGPAAENRVRFAAIACSTDPQRKGGKLMRFAGRAGMGMVMVSKNLLAVVAHGTMKIPGLVPNAVMTPFNKEVSRGEGSARYRELGTWPFNIEALTGPKGGLPIRNFSTANDPRARGLYVGKVRKRYAVNDQNCTACGIKCWKVLQDGTEVLAKLDHEPLTLLGPNLDIWDIGEIAHLVELCDEMGMDSISLGGVLGYAMEHGLDGLEFGNAAAAEQAIRKIATGESPFLAQGVRRLGRLVGDSDTAIHVHGMELAAYLGNTDPGAAFALVGNHMTMATGCDYAFRRLTT
jgi:aldehyde:ferredoxin oxidoreductase